jgi:hypothetical protein
MRKNLNKNEAHLTPSKQILVFSFSTMRLLSFSTACSKVSSSTVLSEVLAAGVIFAMLTMASRLLNIRLSSVAL